MLQIFMPIAGRRGEGRVHACRGNLDGIVSSNGVLPFDICAGTPWCTGVPSDDKEEEMSSL